MLTNKDYCDYDTSVALRGLGYNAPQRLIPDYFGVFDEPKYDEKIHLYDAQKWLREIHNIFVMIDRSFAASNSWHYVICANDDFEHLIEQSSLENYSYEEALSEGVRASIEILKEE